MPSRRDFAKFVLAGGAGMLAPRELWPSAAGAPIPPQTANEKFDLLIEGGTVIDPSQSLNGPLDVAIKDGKILEVSKNIAKTARSRPSPRKTGSSRRASSICTRIATMVFRSG